MAAIAIIYAVFGCAVTLWFLYDCTRARQRIAAGTGSPSDARVISMLKPKTLAVFLPFLFACWPIAVALYAMSGSDDEDDNPQSNVPPQYR